MSIELSEYLENIIDSKAGIPSHRVCLYDTMFPWNSKGLYATYYRLIKVGTSNIKSRIDSVHVFGDDKPYIDGVPLRIEYVNSLRFWWGKGYPNGITKDMAGRLGWGARYSGYFITSKDGRYSFRVFSSLYCRVVIAGTEVLSGRDPTSRSTIGSVYLNGGYSVPIDIYVAQTSGMGSGATSKLDDALLLVEWRVEGDDFDWKPVDVGYFSPGATLTNSVGNAIDTSSPLQTTQGKKFFSNPTSKSGYEYLIGQSQDTITPASGSWLDGEEYILSFSQEYGNTFSYYISGDKKGTVQSYTTSTITIDGEKQVMVSWGNIEQNSIVTVKAPGFLEPLVSSNGLPHIQEISENRTEGESTTFSFTVPLTTAKWNPRYVTPDNCYSYDSHSQAMGVLRKHRFITIDQGYSGHLVTRFTGFISDVEVSDTSTESLIKITCLDLGKLLIDKFVLEAPDKVSWMRYGSGVQLSDYSPGEYIRDGLYMPKCYDAWNLKDTVCDLLYMSGLSSRSINAKDENNQSYIVDNNSRLSKSIDYPYSVIETSIGDIRESGYKWEMELGSTYWDILKRIETEFGRSFRFLPNGEFDLRLPDNPNLLKLYYDPKDPYTNSEQEAIKISERIIPKSTPEVNVRGIRGFFYSQYGDAKDAYTISFEGQGLALIIARPDRSHEIQVEVDGIIVDGATVLDEDTGDVGDIEYTSLLDEDKWYPLKLTDSNGITIELDEKDGYWAFSDSTHPALGFNPCVIPICRNLTWGKHTVTIHTKAIGYVRLDGAYIYKDNKNAISRILSSDKDILNISITESDADVRNVVIVMGTQQGNIPIFVKSVNADSISNPNSPIYIGYERPIIIINEFLNNAKKAEFIANYLLHRHSRVIRNPNIEMVANPSLLEGDCISVIDYRIGMRLPLTIQTGSKVVAMEPSKGEKYWITSLSSSMSHNQWNMQLQITPFSPMSAYDPLPDPPKEIWDDHLVSNLRIYLKNKGTDITIFNPYEEDTDGERIVIEFDLPWNARAINVGVYNRRTYNFLVNPSRNTFTNTILRDELISPLLWNEDYCEAGHYRLEWDGWWNGKDTQSDLASGGRYMPKGYDATAEFYVKIYVQREKDGRSLWYISDNSMFSSVGVNCPKYILPDDSIYGSGNTYLLPVEQEYSGHSHIDYTIFDDSTNQPIAPGTFIVKTTLNRPSSFFIKGFAYLYMATLQNDGDPIIDSMLVIEGFPISLFVSPEIFSEGIFPIVFSPSSMLRNTEGLITSLARNWYTQVGNREFDKYKDYPFLPGLLPDMNIPFNYVIPRTGGLQTLSQWNAWLFYFPSMWGIGGGEGGFLTIDKNGKMFSNFTGVSLGTSDNPHGIIVQWFGDRNIFSTTKTSSSDIIISLPIGQFDVDPLGSAGKTNWDEKRKFNLEHIVFTKVYTPL